MNLFSGFNDRWTEILTQTFLCWPWLECWR